MYKCFFDINKALKVICTSNLVFYIYDSFNVISITFIFPFLINPYTL